MAARPAGLTEDEWARCVAAARELADDDEEAACLLRELADQMARAKESESSPRAVRLLVR